jgi:hypothetical protein
MRNDGLPRRSAWLLGTVCRLDGKVKSIIQKRSGRRRPANLARQMRHEEINAILGGWVNYFQIGHSSRCNCLTSDSPGPAGKALRYLVRNQLRNRLFTVVVIQGQNQLRDRSKLGIVIT